MANPPEARVRQAMGAGGLNIPSAGRGVIGLVVIHVVAWVVYLLMLRLGVEFAARELALVPRDFLLHGRLWQAVTGVLLHAPSDVGHLLFNMLFLWWFGSPIEGWWGARGLIRAYIACALGGVLLTVLVGAGVALLAPGSGLGHLWTGAHLGASGAVLGLTVCWGAVLWNERMNFMFFGEMRVRTFILVLVGIQVLVALSYDGTSSTSHFGGILVGYLYGRGWLRPARLRNWLTHRRVQAQAEERKKKRARFEVIEGGAEPRWQRRDDDEPMVH